MNDARAADRARPLQLSRVLVSPGVILAPLTAAGGALLRLGSASAGRWLSALTNRGAGGGCWQAQLRATVLPPGCVLRGGWASDCVNLGAAQALEGTDVTAEGAVLDLILYSPVQPHACALPSDVRALAASQAAAARAAFSTFSDDSGSASPPGETWAESPATLPVCAFARRAGGQWLLTHRLESGRHHLYASLWCQTAAEPAIATLSLRGFAPPSAAELAVLGALAGTGPVPPPRPLAELPWRPELS